ncbi:xanthine dehydrogenase accessory protein XdhC [Halomonas getboli]|uniref:xanthine dehydrogenase accessory protein XdhC n=1 Tax=Halomonas getboli TaxID=2935862 RepID=UPI001FFF40D6|nr:xanthine dehydrogenase accessory protein XdhC [Halomonas getboli]MCK2183291.1 xanthine dehydrogenase accessory protein XdhC [Halomonas getboli]
MHPPEPWYAALARLQREARPHALASVVGVAGSTPREPGAKMVITADDVHDTLGGGHFEQQVIEAAREALASGRTDTRLEAFPLGGRSGQCCGGYVHVLIEPFAGAEMEIALFGAGHVGRALVQALAPLPWRVWWFDSREHAFPDDVADRDRLLHIRLASRDEGANVEGVDVEGAVAALPAGCHALVMTHDHAEDRALVDALLRRGDCASIGMIGSDSKWASFKTRLRDAGHDEAALATVRCPIGVPGAHGKRPCEIALAVAAELLTLKPDTARDDRRGVAPETLRQAFPSDR